MRRRPPSATRTDIPYTTLSVSYATRCDSKQSAATRLLVMTPGLFRNRILADPELQGVSAVLFDEVHERSLDGDFALALAIDAQQGLRDDLRLVAMRSEEHTSELQSLMRISYAVFCLKKKPKALQST